MIRVSCPKCQKKLGLVDALAGGVGVCPACGAKFRVPKVTAPAAGKPTAPPKSSGAAKPVVPIKEVGIKSVVPIKAQPTAKDSGFKPGVPPPVSPDKPLPEDDDDDVGSYEVVKDPEPPPEPKKKRRKMEQDEIEEIGVDKEYLRRKKRKTKKKSSEMGMGGSLWAGIGMCVCWVALGILTWFVPQAGIVMLGFGALAAFAGSIWFLVVAFQESVQWGLLCLFVPFASLVFVVKYYDRALVPFIVQLVGSFIILTAIVTVGLKVISTMSPEDLNPPTVNRPSSP
jgi:hypothetical protein